MLLRLLYMICVLIITIDFPTSYATRTKVSDVHKVENIYGNKTITRNYVVHAKDTPVSINEKINIYILPEGQKPREDKNTVVNKFRDVEEVEPKTFKTKSPMSTQGIYGVEWFGKGVRRAPPVRLRVPRNVLVTPSPQTVDKETSGPDTTLSALADFYIYMLVKHVLVTPSPHTVDKETSGPDTSLNALADFFIDMLVKQIAERGQNQIKIPDIHETFHKRDGPIKIKGTFDAVNGWFRSLAFLRRTTDVTVSVKGDILTVQLGVGLDSMELGYENYEAKFENIGPKGTIKGEVDHNLLVLELAVDISNPSCKVSLQKLYFKEFSELKIHLTGLGKLSWAFSKIVTWITDSFKGDIVHSAENILKENVENILSRYC